MFISLRVCAYDILIQLLAIIVILCMLPIAIFTDKAVLWILKNEKGKLL